MFESFTEIECKWECLSVGLSVEMHDPMALGAVKVLESIDDFVSDAIGISRIV